MLFCPFNADVYKFLFNNIDLYMRITIRIYYTTYEVKCQMNFCKICYFVIKKYGRSVVKGNSNVRRLINYSLFNIQCSIVNSPAPSLSAWRCLFCSYFQDRHNLSDPVIFFYLSFSAAPKAPPSPY